MTRPTTSNEIQAAQHLQDLVGDHAYLRPTKTALDKSIIDAITSLRVYFADTQFHTYDTQTQGPSGKVVAQGQYIASGTLTPCKVSMYRPNTKDGDPRIWFSGLNEWARPADLLGVFVHQSVAYIINLSHHPLGWFTEEQINTTNTEDLALLKDVKRQREEPSQHLFRLLQQHTNRWIPTVVNAPTGVGRTIELLLGIKMNSSTEADFHGIELKTSRKNAGKQTRTTLFAKVPNWGVDFTLCNGSAELLQRYGYNREKGRKLYCQLNHSKANSQSLQLSLNQTTDALNVIHTGKSTHINQQHENRRPDIACAWEMAILRQRLKEKHATTCWIDVETRQLQHGEEFRLIGVELTERPFITLFDNAIRNDAVTVDFLIKEDKGRVHDKGYLFKIDPRRRSELFPPPKTLSLR
jgi:hypothetical protein